MKKFIVYIPLLFILLSACNWTSRSDKWLDSDTDLKSLVQSYDLWYVDFDRTEGTGNIDFMSKAFTMSFTPDFEVYANNNIVGLGITGNGYGIGIGIYSTDEYNGILRIVDDLSGAYNFEVTQTGYNEISLYNRVENVRYYLVGYMMYQFDFDKLFYDNITYYLQEYEAWRKYNDDLLDNTQPFVHENFLTFFVQGNTNVFLSSESLPSTPIAQIYWDYTGTYSVSNTIRNQDKQLYLYYDVNNSQEVFLMTIIDDAHIRLQNLDTDNIYYFEGINFIQYKPNAKRVKSGAVQNNTYLKL